MAYRARERDQDYRDDRRGARDTRTDGREPKRPRNDLNEFFVDGNGIHREVLQKEICRFLGPEAISKPAKYQGVDGFLIKAVRPFTQEMLDDLKHLSKGYVSEREEMKRKGRRDFSYGESETSRRQDAHMDTEDESDGPYMAEDDHRRYPPASVYPPANSQASYAPPAPGFAPAQGMAYPQPGYNPGPMAPQGSAYPPGSTYPGQGYPAMTRPGPHENNYAYGGVEYGGSNDLYPRQPGAYPPHEARGEIRDAPRPYPSNSGVRMEPPRPDPRPDPRYQYVNSPPANTDVSMSGMSERYDYVSAPPPMAAARGYPEPSRPMPTGYGTKRDSPVLRDPRDPRDQRDPYRHEQPRDDRRRR